jgi:hypothetical protein
MGIKVVKEKKAMDYTFLDDNSLNLGKSTERQGPDAKKEKVVRDYRLRDDGKINKLKKSKISGGNSMQGHSPVYE